ncbi:hypothetical protein F4818DRAFT_427623 [Hypoxylon cercidicola]|nr:hypothetical protein F4818DRAFT_427623 [Hypoxylon cercidicola]
MKLKSFLLPALAGIATASADEQQHAEAYILRQSKTTTNPPSIPDELARAILLQRLSTPQHPSALGQLPESLSQDESVSYVRQFGKLPPSLFEDVDDAKAPSQLVIALSGVANKYDDVKAAISPVPLAFTAPGLSHLPAGGKKTSCAFEQSINPENNKCWKGKTQYLEYDVAKDSNVIVQLSKNLEFLTAQALDGKLETTVLLLAPPTQSEELRRRDMELDEQVMAEEQEPEAEATYVPTADSKLNGDTDKAFHAFASSPKPAGVLPACFESRNACVSATGGCSGHGQCVDRWGASSSTDKACFFCHCMSTVEPVGGGAENRTGVFHWGGGACHKRDVSTPFWLFAGVTLALVATVAFAIGLLFSVGEEKLPGVIGAGVSRSK